MSAVFGDPEKLFFTQTHCVSQWALWSEAPAPASPGAEQTIRKEALPLPGARREAVQDLFMCSQLEWPGSFAAHRKRGPGRYKLESEAPGLQGPRLPQT